MFCTKGSEYFKDVRYSFEVLFAIMPAEAFSLLSYLLFIYNVIRILLIKWHIVKIDF